MMDRYCVPTSFPCRLSVVGSWDAKKTVISVRNDTCAGSYSIRVTSAWPVRPVDTSSYVGFGLVPPAYPGITDTTPLSILKTASVHQKHPPPKIATSLMFQVYLSH